MFFFLKQVRIFSEKDWSSHQCPYGDKMCYKATLLMNHHFLMLAHCAVGGIWVHKDHTEDHFGPFDTTHDYKDIYRTP